MTYIDGFVAAVPAANREVYRKHASDAVPLFKKLGASRIVECWGEDVPEGKVTDFRKAVKAEPDEVIVFSWIVYPDKATRDEAGRRLMEDLDLPDLGELPFDGKRMIFGGFEPVFDSGDSGRFSYVDGTLIAVPDTSREVFRDYCARSGEIFRDHGALRVVDCWGTDIPDGKVTDFKGAVKAEDGETVVFGWVEWQSKAARDAGWAKMMEDSRMEGLRAMPFDGMRMVYGGFAPIVDL